MSNNSKGKILRSGIAHVSGKTQPWMSYHFLASWVELPVMAQLLGPAFITYGKHDHAEKQLSLGSTKHLLEPHPGLFVTFIPLSQLPSGTMPYLSDWLVSCSQQLCSDQLHDSRHV